MSRLVSCVAALTLAIGLSACKQGEGEYCQVTKDCEDGLTCVTGTHTCESRGGGTAVDGGEVDAAIDARLDAPPDATTDAPIDAP